MIFVFHCAGAIHHSVHFATTSFLQVSSVFMPRKVKATLTTLTPVFPLFSGSLLSLTSDHSYFFILLDSISCLTWIIIVIKKSKTILKLSACYISKIEMHCFQMRHVPLVRDIENTLELYGKFMWENLWWSLTLWLIEIKLQQWCSSANLLHNSEHFLLKTSVGDTAILFLQVLIEFIM